MDLAGLSPQPLLVNLKNSSKPELSELCLNNNSTLVIPEDTTRDVMVVLNTTQWIIMQPTVSVPKPLILIPPEMVNKDHAYNPAAPWIPSESLDTESLLVYLNSKTLTNNDPWPLLVMPPDGHHTPVVSSPTVEDNSITPSYLLDIPALIGSLKTHGVDLGENLDISDFSEMPLPVVLLMMLLIPPYERIK